jgi:hypothetical protein
MDAEICLALSPSIHDYYMPARREFIAVGMREQIMLNG